ncbi:hydrolase [Streptomyces sp. CB01201]|uniref:glycoside hydrolase family 25 protein n=1 Tax=Streptomyces sp. CB01201 TaxID=2020324 RepID=UPI000C27AD5D|nr:glycoside hydrolase family 25 protein [Streptomyces sp. CB01201]PJN00784.1 hydrolase [Streptomyces sp. CB01201]
MGAYGQDWASYQSAQPDTSGLSFVFAKVTEGLGYTSPVWVAQRDHAKANGLVTGFYHYPHIANDPVAEADFFLRQINLAPGDLLVLDWEWYGQNVTNAQARAYKTAWLARVKAKAPGHRVGVYADRNNWLTVDADSNAGDFLWIADYVPAGQPRIQADWLFHQYGSQPVDKDYCHLDAAALRVWALGTQPQPEDDMPTPADVWSYSHGDKPDVHQTLANAANAAVAAQAGVAALSKKVDALTTTGASDAQMQALAASIASNPALADAIAAKVAANIAARLAN